MSGSAGAGSAPASLSPSPRPPPSCSTTICAASISTTSWGRSRRPSCATSPSRPASWPPLISRSLSMICSPCAPSAARTCPTGSRRSPPSPAMRSGTMSGRASSQAGRCATASTRPTDCRRSMSRRSASSAGGASGFGTPAVLCSALPHAPTAGSALVQLPPWFNRAAALGVLGVLVAYVAWVWRTPRVIGWQNWEVTLPNGRLTLLQIVIGIIDLSCCAAAMYMLVPDEPYIGFIVLAVIFVAATLLGFASHSPGGLGVFDAAMLVALWQYDKEDLLAGLLLFRVLYYLTPFAFSLAILGGREIWLSLRARRALTAAARAPPPAAEPTASRRTRDTVDTA